MKNNTEIEIRDVEDKREWDDFVTSHPEANFLQSWQWGVFHQSRGREFVRRGAYRDGQLVGVYSGEVEHARRGSFMAVAGGPIVEWGDQAVVEALFADMRAAGRAKKCAFVRVRPQLELSTESLELMKSLGLKRAPYYLSVEHAGVLDITKSEDEIIKGMKQRLRRSLRKAEKEGIEISTSTDPADIDQFYEVQLATAKRHGFSAFGREFLRKQFAAFVADDSAVLYTATYQGQVLAQNFIIFYGNEAAYHYAASTELGTRHSGAPLLHMQAMRDARERGIRRYNFWGIVDVDQTRHRFFGVSVFKRGFGVTELKYTPAHDIVISPVRYAADWLIETVRRKWRHV